MQLAVTLKLWAHPAVHRFWSDRLAPFVEKVVEVKLTDTQTELLLGNYGWEKMVISTIFRAAKTASSFRIRNLPTSCDLGNRILTRKWVFWHLTFQKNADGKVIKVINKEPRATWEAPKT